MNRYDPATGMWNFPGTEGLVVAAIFILALLWILSGIRGEVRDYRQSGPIRKSWLGCSGLLFYGFTIYLLLNVLGAVIGGFR